MVLELWVKPTDGPPERIHAEHTAGGVLCHHDRGGRLGQYQIDGKELRFLKVPAAVEWVGVRQPLYGPQPTCLYEPQRLGLRHRFPLLREISCTYPGTAHAPVMATCGPQGGTILGCTQDRTVELAASDLGLELRFPKPTSMTTAKLIAGSGAGMIAAVKDVGFILDAFLAAWLAENGLKGPPEPSRELESQPLMVDFQAQDVPPEGRERAFRDIVRAHRGWTNLFAVWGLQNDPAYGCCEPIIEWSAQNAWMIPLASELRDQRIHILPYTRPDIPEGAGTLPHWMGRNALRGCDHAYIDHVKARTAEVQACWTPLSIREWPSLGNHKFGVLASGCIAGASPGSETWPDGMPRHGNPSCSTWPEMGRRLFPRTKFFLGCQNSDAMWWGLPFDANEPRRFAHATERAAFRLGMGLAPRPQPYLDGRPWGLNECTQEIMAAWYGSRFWSRRMYWRGAQVNEPGLYASRFTDDQGRSVLCVDRWEDASMEREIDVGGTKVALPTNKRIAIVEVP